jgi:hypothetical protein
METFATWFHAILLDSRFFFGGSVTIGTRSSVPSAYVFNRKR